MYGINRSTEAFQGKIRLPSSSKVDPARLCIFCMQVKEEAGEPCPYCSGRGNTYQHQAQWLEPWTILKGRYLLGAVLGTGGFGITYAAYDLVDRKRAAIKELFVTGCVTREKTSMVLVNAGDDIMLYYQECKSKFLQEAEVLRHLEDKNGVVDIFDSFQENETAYIVMEFLDGIDLKRYLGERGGKISYLESFTLLRPIMKSLIPIHVEGIVHRDISPDNIRCLDNHTAKIMDFGSAKVLIAENISRVIFVKKGYAPPEQYTSAYRQGPWMDVYAICATFYRCVTGRIPAASNERLAGHASLTRPSALGAQLPSDVEEVLLRGMELDPEDRYQDMYQLYEALKEANFKAFGTRYPQLESRPPEQNTGAGAAEGYDGDGRQEEEKKRAYQEFLRGMSPEISSISLGARVFVLILLIYVCSIGLNVIQAH